MSFLVGMLVYLQYQTEQSIGDCRGEIGRKHGQSLLSLLLLFLNDFHNFLRQVCVNTSNHTRLLSLLQNKRETNILGLSVEMFRMTPFPFVFMRHYFQFSNC